MTNDPTIIATTKAIETIVETVVKSLTEAAKGAGRAAWERVRWVEAASHYRDQLKDRYSTMRVLGKPKPIPLEDIFTEVYLLDKPVALRRFNLKELHQLQTEAKPFSELGNYKRVHALRLARQEPRLFILGKPGAGKTTFLKYLTLQADKLKKVPIFISFNEWAEGGLELVAFIEKQFEICQFPSARQFIEKLLKNGQGLILMDGLDEVNEADDLRLKTSRTLTNFIQQYGKNQFIITCRIAASDYIFEKFTYVELADFTSEQAESFARKWFAESPKTSVNFWTELKRDTHRGLRELAHSPLLLTLLCLNYEETFTFPVRRVEIYEEAVDALLKKWDTSRGIKRDDVYKGLSLGRKRQLLTYIAADYFERGQIFFPTQDLARKIEAFIARLSPIETENSPDGEAILKTIEAQHGLLVERAKGIYSFSHLTLQEYFTARYISEHAETRVLEGLVAHMTDRRWHETFLLTASLLQTSDDFFRRFRIALDMLVANGFNDYALYFKWLKTKAKDYETIHHPAIARALTRAFDHASTHPIDLSPLGGFNFLDPAKIGASELVRVSALDIDRALDSASDLARALNFNLALNHTSISVLDLELAGTRALALTLALDLARFSDIALDLALELTSDLNSDFAHAKDIASKLGLLELMEVLQTLPIPLYNAPATQWQTFAYDLRKIMVHQRDLGHDWEFSTQDEQTMDNYEKATVLLAECLRLAAVSSPDVRKKIENSLLLPPGEWETW